jgi:hypothetical protein
MCKSTQLAVDIKSILINYKQSIRQKLRIQVEHEEAMMSREAGGSLPLMVKDTEVF